jgi:thymidylate synthase (FAD)
MRILTPEEIEELYNGGKGKDYNFEKPRKMKVELISKTEGSGVFSGKSLDELIVGQARVSTSREVNELFDEPHKLLRHCILNGHWSIFTLANLGFKIETSRAMGRELLRHGIQTGLTEFSQRYSGDIEFEDVEIRQQAKSNRQSSTEVMTEFSQADVQQQFGVAYENLIRNGAARECARMFLPEATKTTIYMNFRLRELITFLNVRLHHTAQKEIRLIAEEVKKIFLKECPIISECLFNFEDADKMHVLEQVVLEKYGVRENILDNM